MDEVARWCCNPFTSPLEGEVGPRSIAHLFPPPLWGREQTSASWGSSAMMKFTLRWLKEHLDTDRPLGELVDKLTMIGLEVERVEDKGKTLAPFVIARVVEAKQHPNADRLRVCMVDTGGGAPVQVVCGAPNARAGMKGVFVPPGAYIPGKDMTLQVGTIRGVESRGMLVSEFELHISDNHEGIIDLPDDAPVGANYGQWAGLDDPVIEINLTPEPRRLRRACTASPAILPRRAWEN